MESPYYSRNIRINKVFGDDYSVQAIKEKIELIIDEINTLYDQRNAYNRIIDL